MRIAMSFDDGRKDNFEVVMPVLLKYELTATFNISTAYVDGTISKEDRPCKNAAMSKEDIVKLADYGFEIACHGDHHKNDSEDIRNGRTKLASWLGWDSRFKPGFASPRSNLSIDEIHGNREFFQELFSYIRIASYGKEGIARKLLRKIAHKTHSRILYRYAYRNCIGGVRDGFVATSVSVIKDATLEQVISLIKMAERKDKDCNLMLHRIQGITESEANDLWCWDVNKFEKLCKWLYEEKQLNNLEVVNTIDMLA